MKFICAGLSALLFTGLTAGSATASPWSTAKVVSSYSGCSLTDNGDGTSTATVNIDFNQSEGNTDGKHLISRGLMINIYDEKGVPQNTLPDFAILNGHQGNPPEIRPGYLLIHGTEWAWDNDLAQHTRASVKFKNASIAGWPAIFIRAANYVEGFEEVAEVSGGAYITAGTNGVCRRLIDPATPPPFNINITVNAPDWELGEISPGPQTMPLSGARDRLCLQYSDGEVSTKPFIINASNQNGMADGRYQLKNLQESSQVIPYELILENGSRQVLLPNNSSASIPLDKGGKTCFSPLFRTFAPKTIQPGDYSDVLTFTIVTPT